VQGLIYAQCKNSVERHTVKDCQIVIKKDEAGSYIATCPTLKGCHTYGATLEEALDNIEECIELCQEELEETEQNSS